MTPGVALKRLESLRDVFEGDAAETKLALLARLDRGRLARAGDVARLHEVLCFLRAYPDDSVLLARVEKMLSGFAARADLRRHAEALANSGIAGTPIDYNFYWFTAHWLAERWPERLSIDWDNFENGSLLADRLFLLMPYAENLALDEMSLPTREWIRRLKGAGETDAAFLVRRYERLRVGSFMRESAYEELDLPCRLAPGPDTPSRTHARYARSPVVFQTGPLVRSRDAFRPALERSPRSVEPVPPRRARALLALAREAMITRDRDLDIFIHADPNDVRMIDCGDGLQFACYGMIPERRQMLDAVYGFLMLKNGVPVGYVLVASLFQSAEIAFNVFETYRDSEAARLFGCSLAIARRLFRADTFVLDPYQMGHDNDEGLESGAWWFYYKLGFRPKDTKIKRLVSTELRRLRANPRYRSSVDTLQELSEKEMFLHLGRPRRDVIGMFSRESVGLRIMRYMAERFGADREAGVETCSREVADMLGARADSILHDRAAGLETLVPPGAHPARCGALASRRQGRSGARHPRQGGAARIRLRHAVRSSPAVANCGGEARPPQRQAMTRDWVRVSTTNGGGSHP